MPGLVAQGRTIAETMEIAQDVARKLIESYADHGDPLPKKFRASRAQSASFRIPIAVGE
jgi:predicted RNase H-like HicB family nuclease